MHDHMIRKKLWAKLKSIFSPMQDSGRSSPKENEEASGSLSNKLSINEECTNAFGTKSYIEMWSRAHAMRTSINDPSSSSSCRPFLTQLSENFLDPRQETLKDLTKSLNFHHLLSLEACNVCELLLQSIHQTRIHNKKIKWVIKLSKRVDGEECGTIFEELARFSAAKNPLSALNLALFRDFHDNNLVLLQRLTSKRRRIKRKNKLKSIWKEIMSYTLIASHSALVITLIVIALHSLIGLAAAPIGIGIVICFLYLSSLKKKIKHNNKTELGSQFDMAAKGMIILMNDFDTISVLVRRLHDEIEHRKEIAGMCVRYGRSEVWKEVVKELYVSQNVFLEQLDELEKYVYLRFHIIKGIPNGFKGGGGICKIHHQMQKNDFQWEGGG